MSVQMKQVEFSYQKSGKENKSEDFSSPVVSIERLDIASGEQVFIHGPSGSGKTTLLGLIAGVLVPDRGTLLVLDKDFAKLSSAARDEFRGNQIGYIFQQFNLIPYLNVLHNIELPCLLHPERKRKLKKTLRESVEEIATRLHIDDLLDRSVSELSVGQSQRVAAARALIGDPGIIIADEPTSSLDADRREIFLELLFENCSRSGATLIFVSHDMGLAQNFNRIISLSDINHINNKNRDSIGA